MSSPFKANDIRGKAGTQITEDLAYQVGRALVDHLLAERIVVGHDVRPSSPALAAAICAGIRKQGATAIALGPIATPMAYYANITLDACASVMVTASHNPPGDNGFKINRRGGAPIGLATGLSHIRNIIADKAWFTGCCPGPLQHHDIKPAYYARMRREAHFSGRPRVVCDYANSVGAIEMAGLTDLFDHVPLYEQLDGTFPNHLANPLITSTLADLQASVTTHRASCGAAFDGDADRLGFVDEQGQIVRLDHVTALLAEQPLATHGPAPILHDVRTGWSVRQHIRQLGGIPVPWSVGHAFMKPKMAAIGAPFGGELAGHYYFQELGCQESSALVFIRMLNLLDQRETSLSDLVAPLCRYANTGEINLHLPDGRIVPPLIKALRQRYRGNRHEIDGLTVEYPDWWFNLRPSNTEPILRLLVEATDEHILTIHRTQLESFIQDYAQTHA